MSSTDHPQAGDPVAEELERATAMIRGAFSDDAVPGEALDEAVRRFVRRARSRGYPPERAFGALKSIALEVCPPRVERQRLDAVLERLLRRCLAEYYEVERSDAAPSP